MLIGSHNRASKGSTQPQKWSYPMSPSDLKIVNDYANDQPDIANLIRVMR